MFSLTKAQQDSVVEVHQLLDLQVGISDKVYRESSNKECREFQGKKLNHLVLATEVLNLFTPLGQKNSISDFPYKVPTDLPEDVFVSGIHTLVSLIAGQLNRYIETREVLRPNADLIKKYKGFFKAVTEWSNSLGFQLEPWLYNI